MRVRALDEPVVRARSAISASISLGALLQIVV